MLRDVAVPSIGEGYRGVEGRSGYLLRQAWHEFRGAMESVLREHELTTAQFAALTVLRREPGLSSAELARGCNITPQAMNGIVATLEREGLVQRRPHATHGRILQITLTDEGERRVDEARPQVASLEEIAEDGYSDEEIAIIKGWLVSAAKRMVATPKR